MPLQVACFGESCLTIGTHIVVQHFVEIRYQECIVFLDADVHPGHLDLVEVQKQIFQQKGPFVVNLVSSNPLLEIAFDQRGTPFVELPLSNSILIKKTCGKLTNFSRVVLMMPSSMDRDASKNTEIAGVHIQQTPHSNMQWWLKVLDEFHLYHKMIPKPPFPVGAISVFVLEVVFFLIF